MIDPTGIKAGTNFQAYVDNTPITTYDPLGLAGQRGVGPDVVYYICCKKGRLAVCEGPNQRGDQFARKCRQEHEQQHINDMKCNEDNYCKDKPDGPVRVGPNEKARLECDGYRAQLKCLDKTFQSRDVRQDKTHALEQIKKYCPPTPH